MAEGDATSRARGRRPGSCPTASRSCRRRTTGRTSRPTCPGKAIAGVGSAEGVRQPAAGGAHPAHGRAQLPSGAGHRAPLGQQHRERCFPDGQDRTRLLPRRGPLVLGAGLHRTVDVCDADACRRTSRRSRSSTSARACWRRFPAPIRPPKRCSLAQIPQTARVNKKELKAPDVAFTGDPQFTPIEKTTVAARREHRQGRLQDRRRRTTCATRACGSSARAPTGPWEVAELRARGDLQDPRQLARASRHLRHRRRRRCQ